MEVGDAGQITVILDRLRAGDGVAQAELIEVVYSELRRIAAFSLRKERPDHTLQPTALVHETYIRLLGRSSISWENRAHFFATAAHVMHNVLVDHARHSKAQRRRSGGVRVELTEVLAAVQDRADEILAVHEAMKQLAELSPRQKTIVEMKFYMGFTEEEIAEILHIGVRTVKRDWAAARTWLYGYITGSRGAALEAS